MIVQNETVYDGRAVNAIVRFVFRHLGVDDRQHKVMVKVKYHNGAHAYQGRFYSNPRSNSAIVGDYYTGWREIRPQVPAGIDHLIVCRIGKPGTYPCENHVYDRKDSPGTWTVEDWKEALVSITAHEAMHLRQYRKNPAGKRGRFNEVETEWAAFRVWRAWRNR